MRFIPTRDDSAAAYCGRCRGRRRRRCCCRRVLNALADNLRIKRLPRSSFIRPTFLLYSNLKRLLLQ